MAWKQEMPDWGRIGLWFPEFVRWVLQEKKPAVHGPADENDYNRWKREYEQNVGYTEA